MADAINFAVGGTGAPIVQQPRTPAVTVDTPQSSTEIAAKQLRDGLTQPKPLSARIVDDPLAGVVVTQQLDSEGQVAQQTPSISVLAYLRNGLTIEGLPKESTTA